MSRRGHDNGRALRDYVVTYTVEHHEIVRAPDPATAKTRVERMVADRHPNMTVTEVELDPDS